MALGTPEGMLNKTAHILLNVVGWWVRSWIQIWSVWLMMAPKRYAFKSTNQRGLSWIRACLPWDSNHRGCLVWKRKDLGWLCRSDHWHFWVTCRFMGDLWGSYLSLSCEILNLWHMCILFLVFEELCTRCACLWGVSVDSQGNLEQRLSFRKSCWFWNWILN